MTEPELIRTCPSCRAPVEGDPYDIGSGPEFHCTQCDTCFGALGQPLNPYDPTESFTSRDECLKLLQEWYAWWRDSDEAPAKLPDSLQVRTGIVLHLTGLRPGAQFERRTPA